MPTIGLRRFANPDTLKQISQEFLLELLGPYREFYLNLPRSCFSASAFSADVLFGVMPLGIPQLS